MKSAHPLQATSQSIQNILHSPARSILSSEMSVYIKTFFTVFVLFIAAINANESNKESLVEAMKLRSEIKSSTHQVTGQELAQCAPAAAAALAGCGDLATTVFDALGQPGTTFVSIIASLISPEGADCLEFVLPLLRCIGSVVGDNFAAAYGLILLPTQRCYLNLLAAGTPNSLAASACGQCCSTNPSTCATQCGSVGVPA